MIVSSASSILRRNMPPQFIANFDSASAMLRATALYPRGEEFRGVGFLPNAIKPLGGAVNRLPGRSRRRSTSGAAGQRPFEASRWVM
jgi:hypothetical protein